MPSIADFDAIVLHPKDVEKFNNFFSLPNGAPYERSHHNIYIMIESESPRVHHKSEVFESLNGKM